VNSAVLLGAASMVVALALAGCGQAPEAEVARLAGGPTSATDPTPVQLDTAVYLPDSTPAPAVILAHGFGGSRQGLDERATALAEAGFVVLAYTARGFGESSGQISMNAPEFEVADARALIDHLATLPEVALDAPGDPRVGLAGGSYGGALALMTAGYDPRVDAVAADITWNDLETSLFGQSAVGSDERGAFKALWTGNFFGAGVATTTGQATECGRFTDAWCRAYTDAAADSVVTPESAALMAASSPASIADRITAPTLLGAGQADSLFPIAQANATAEQIRAAHPDTPLKVVWHGGGHDGGLDESERLDQMATDWFATYLLGETLATTDFEVTDTTGSISTRNAGTAAVVLAAPTYPGIRGEETTDVAVAGPPQRILAPPGGLPALITSVPGAGGALAASLAPPIPGQSAYFPSAPLDLPLGIVGSSRVTFSVASSGPVIPEATLFASLRVVSPSGRETLPAGLVSPVRVTDLGPDPVTLTVDLPAVVATAATGDRLVLVVSTTDFAYRLPQQPGLIDVVVTDPVLSVPMVAMSPMTGGASPLWWLLGALVIVLVIVLVVWRLRPRHAHRLTGDPDAPPLRITDLSKRYGDGYLAVDHVSFEVPRGTVLGLLGPNGAGKTTTMRMVMGLIRPSGGAIEAFGEPVFPGAPVLARIGALVEGPGFLPHLTGRQNLDLYWRAAGRAHDDPGLDTVLDIADLGSAIDRKVRTYSQGMRQRLGIAQAMLGMPDLLLLDEPTNGLDPPQIKTMRDILHRYAEGGRTVIVSSHLLSEVEQTCTDVVVMHRGRVVAAGAVADLIAGGAGRRLEDAFLEIVGDDLTVGLS
jgi:ABC-2 type transport system ATP-binding protein